MLEPGAARRGGMPLYKFLGNKILTRFENAFLEMNLSEFHSGYRVYAVEALKKIPFESNSDDFHFDTQIIIQLKAAGMRIKEIPIPTYYGDEICHVNGMRYARDVARSVLEYRMHQAGVVRRPEYGHVPPRPYSEKFSAFSSHQRIVDRVAPGTRVLDVGCAGGYLARALAAKGCTVVGVDVRPDPAAEAACRRFHVADLDGGAWEPPRDDRDFDYVLFGDVLEHLRDTSILARCRHWLSPGGKIVASTGNIALWFMRLQLLGGRFRYAPKGILDETHVHLYTRETFRELIRGAGFTITGEDWTVIPIEKLAEAVPSLQPAIAVMDSLQYLLARWRPALFAYQFVVEAEA
jgi:2-polyprenyl-3-methyl-5-hydroxy-6-metoxy-1,4-benzoquinol methylase